MSQESSLIATVAPQFVVPDVVRAAEFYRDRLGFELMGYFLDPPVHAIVRRGYAEVFLAKARPQAGVSNRRLTPVGIDAYFRVQGLDALAAEFAARQVKLIEGPVQRVYGMREVVLEDGDGFVLVFGERSPAPQSSPGPPGRNTKNMS